MLMEMDKIQYVYNKSIWEFITQLNHHYNLMYVCDKYSWEFIMQPNCHYHLMKYLCKIILYVIGYDIDLYEYIFCLRKTCNN